MHVEIPAGVTVLFAKPNGFKHVKAQTRQEKKLLHVVSSAVSTAAGTQLRCLASGHVKSVAVRCFPGPELGGQVSPNGSRSKGPCKEFSIR